MNILVANHHLHLIGGSESFTYALIESLQKKGHVVEYFTLEKGFTSDFIENNLGVQFMSKSKYDLILANHNTCINHLAHKGKIIQTCHGIFPELEQPNEKADAFVSISKEVKDHLMNLGYPSKIIFNGINCERFKSVYPINDELKTVFSLSQSEVANKKIEKACSDLGLQFLKINKHETLVWDIEVEINKADLVVGLGRSAYDAMACERNVVIYDEREYATSNADGILTTNNIDNYIENNCSGRYSKLKFTVDDLKNEFAKYNKSHGKALRDYALKNLNMELNSQVYLDLANTITPKHKLILKFKHLFFDYSYRKKLRKDLRRQKRRVKRHAKRDKLSKS